ncbi:MAG: poly(A) polymerase [Gammaproteobacteria bacterium]|nr:poly(A) polymerase [Gammaproteobacteria bacterium]
MPELAELPGVGSARIISRSEHSISRRDISPNALKVLSRLSNAGFHGFLVGGGVRDLLLGEKPKDFDVATNATPEEVKHLFRNSRIIGRRFRIVHVRFGREIIEVTTFRGAPETHLTISKKSARRSLRYVNSAQNEDGLMVRDNVYGRIDEDAMRRDFTINALYYTTEGFKLLDFCNALSDLRKCQIRMIGDPQERYREDPVRMLRALRFSAKLSFEISDETAAPVESLSDLLSGISPARLFDELIKLFSTGYSQSAYKLLRKSSLKEALLAPTFAALERCQPEDAKLLELAFSNTDSRIAREKSVTPSFLFAALLWPPLRLAMRQTGCKSLDSSPRFLNLANTAIAEQSKYTSIPKRIGYACREIWELQGRLTTRGTQTVDATLNHPRFRAAYDFLLLREAAGEELIDSGKWWTAYQFGDSTERKKLIEALPKVRRRRRGKRRFAGSKS